MSTHRRALIRIAAAAGAALALVFCTAPAGRVEAQDTRGFTVPRARLIEIAREVMESARYCALITVDEGGRASARAMDPFPPDEEMGVWMATNPASRKVEQLDENGTVTLYYFDAATSAYVSLMGEARLVDDPAEKARWWKPEWEAFYADRADAYALIRFEPDSLEVVSVAHGIEGDEASWRAPIVRFPRGG